MRLTRGVLGGALFVVLGVVLQPLVSFAAVGVNTQIPFQGVLNDSGGNPVTDGSYDMVFRIYDAASGGTTLWTGTHTAGNGNPVTVTNGFFDVLLGSGAGNTMTLDFNDDTYYLGISIEADPEMSPRQRLGAAGYAINADRLDGLHASSFIQASSSATSTLDFGLNIFSGCYAVNGVCISGSGASDYVSLTDTPGAFTANHVPYTNAAGNALVDSPSFTFNGTTLTAPEFNATNSDSILELSGATFVHASTTGENTAIGLNAMENNASSTWSVAIGYRTLQNLTGGNSNVGVGANVLRFTTGGTNNTAVGSLSLNANTLGSANSAFGYRALDSNTIGDENIAVGSSALVTNTTGSNNSVIGVSSLLDNTTGSYNSVVGNNALRNNTSATNSVAIGANAGFGNAGDYSARFNILIGNFAGDDITTGADQNIVIGYDVDLPNNSGSNQLNIGNLLFGTGIDGTDQTLSSGNIGIGTSSPESKLTVAGTVLAESFNATNSNSILELNGTTFVAASTTGFNTALGIEALPFTTSGINNTAVGHRAMYLNTSGSYNTGMGRLALRNNTTGTDNTAIGYQALTDNTTGGFNVAMGVNALANNTSATSNVAVGWFAGVGLSGYSAEENIFIGLRAADEVTTGANHNIVIGYDIDLPNNSGSNQLNIGNLIFGTGIDGGDTTLSSGNIGIGTTTPYAKLSVAGTAVAESFNATNSASILELNGATLLVASTTGNNIAFGFSAGQSNLSGVGNTAIGTDALMAATSSGNNTALGYQALRDNEGGEENTAIGSNTMVGNTYGDDNTAVGRSVLAVNTTGSSNTAMGRQAMRNNISGASNVAIGAFALNESITGDTNTAVGYNALGENTSATNTTALGYRAGRGAVGSNFQNGVFIGYESGASLTTGANNTFLGYQTGDNVTTGSNNIIIGYDINAPSATGDNQLNIGNLLFGTGIDGTESILSSGNIGIGTTSPGRKLTVEESSDTDTFRVADTDGVCDHNPESGGETISCSSDARLKTNIVDATSTLKHLNDFHIRDFEVIASGDERTGVVAQETILTHPEMVHIGEDGLYKVEQPNPWKIVKAIQELTDMVAQLNQQIFDTLFAKKIVVENLEATEASLEKVTTKELCVDDVCIDAETLRELLERETSTARTDNDSRHKEPSSQKQKEDEREQQPDTRTAEEEKESDAQNNAKATTTESIEENSNEDEAEQREAEHDEETTEEENTGSDEEVLQEEEHEVQEIEEDDDEDEDEEQETPQSEETTDEETISSEEDVDELTE